MPVQKSQGGLSAKLAQKGAAAAHEAHKGDETQLGAGSRLPSGIDGGVAQLVGAKLDTYKTGQLQGEIYFQLKAVAVAPDTFTDPRTKVTSKVAGLQLQPRMVPLCDTTRQDGTVVPFADHWGEMLNDLRKLGTDTTAMDHDNLEESLAALQEAGPFFTYSTSESPANPPQYPNPRKWENWGMACEFQPGEDSGVEDQTAAPPPAAAPPKAKAAPAKTQTAPATKAAPKTAAKTQAKPPEPPAENDHDQLRELARQADEEENAEAAHAIDGRAKVYGIDSAPAANWAEVVEQIIAADGAGGNDGNDESAPAASEDEPAPQKEEIYFYKPKGAKKAIECEVVAVFDSAKKVNLKNLDDQKTVYKAVPWGDLAAQA